LAVRTIIFIAALITALMTALMTAQVIGLVSPPINFSKLNAALSRFSEHSLALIQRSFTPVKAETEPVDAKAAANLDEDLDWKVASAAKTDAALRKFLADHPNGAHAVEAQLKLDKIAPQQPAAPQALASEPPPPEPPPPEPPATPQLKIVAVPLLAPPVVEVANAPPREDDVFARLEQTAAKEQPTQTIQTRTIIKWQHERVRVRTVVEWRYLWPRYRRYYRPVPPPNSFQAFFGPRRPHRWDMQR
jgi:hypothetical protein